MSTFKQRMRPILEGLAEGKDRDTLIALIDYHDSPGQSGFHPKTGIRATRQYLRQQTARERSAPQSGRPAHPPAQPSGRKIEVN